MSVEMTSEAVSYEASGQTSRKGFLREVEQRLSDNEHEQNMIVREAAPDLPEEQSPDLPEEQSLERPEEQSPEDAVHSLIQKLKRHLPYLSADKKLWSNTATCDAQIPCNSQSADTTETTTEPWQQHGICEIVEPSPDGEIPNFSEDDSTPTTDGQETCESSEGNSTFMVLSESRRLSQSTEQCPRHSHSKSLRRMSIQATPKHKKTIGNSPCRQSVAATSKHKKAICLSPLKIDMFYHRKHNKPSPQKGQPCRSSSVLKLSSLTWARNRKQSMKSGRDKHSEQVSREGVKRAQQQLKEREMLRKKNLARAKSASVPQRFTSRSDALLREFTRAAPKPPPNVSRKTSSNTTIPREDPPPPPMVTPAANVENNRASTCERSMPPGGESSNHNQLAPPSGQSDNYTLHVSRPKNKLPTPQVVLSGVSMPVPQTASSRLLSVDADFLLLILRWNPNWLSEQQAHRERVPSVVDLMKVWPLLDSYDSFDQYVEIVKPLLLLETWQSVQRDWTKKRPGSDSHRQMFPFHIPHFDRSRYIDLICQGVLSREQEDASRPIQKDDLLMLNLSLTHRDGHAIDYTKPVFGHVLEVTNKSQTLHPLIVKGKDCVVTQISVRLHYRKCHIDEKKLMTVTIVSSLTTAIRQFRGLMSLPKSRLCRDILRPVNQQVFVSSLPGETTQRSLQERVAHSAADCALGPPILPRICLIQGPPGTGKTTTIIDIITRILSSARQHAPVNKTPKILLCAPSNAAVDELMRRLILKQKMEKKDGKSSSPIQIVRVGQSSRMHPDIHPYSLDALAKARSQENQRLSCPSSIRRAIDSIRSKINALEQNFEIFLAAGKEPEANKMKEDREREKKKLKTLEASLASKTGHIRRFPGCDQATRRDVLLSADVVCCTLSSCGSDSMQYLIPSKSTDTSTVPRLPHFTCIIVDEAAQCVELDCLIPLQFGCSKMILVGDQQQLPATVISKKAQENNYNQSLFDRFYNYFQVIRWPHTPIQLLDLQYRMHPDICYFPSQHFYDGQLRTDPKCKRQREMFAYHHYLLFDVAYGEEQQDGARGVSNKMEANFVVKLCERLVADVDPKHIGIITPYQKQKELIKRYLSERGQQNIDISTVDGFQGREKDVIVLSCVRARSIAGSIGFLVDKRRMNVALTRAKYALYIAGHVSSLQVNSDWRKLFENAKERHLVVKVNSASDARRVIHERCKSHSHTNEVAQK